VTISWKTKHASTVYWKERRKELDINGSMAVQPVATESITLLATNDHCSAKTEGNIYVVESIPWNNSTAIGVAALAIEAAIVPLTALYAGTLKGGALAFQQAGVVVQGNIWLALASFLEKKRKKRWGIVYDAVTKKPIARAVIRLIQVSMGKVVDTSVTDARGFLSLTAPVGKYLVKVSHPQYRFPSSIVKESTDGGYAQVYRGEILTINEIRSSILISVPLDPIELSPLKRLKAQGIALMERIGNIGSSGILLAGLVYSSYAAMVYPHLYNFASTGVFILLITAKVTLFLVHPKTAGTVKTRDGQVVSGIEIGLYEKDFGTLVYRTFTNTGGKYTFFVNKGKYSIQVADNRYQLLLHGKRVKEIVLRQNEKGDTNQFVVEDLILDKKIVS